MTFLYVLISALCASTLIDALLRRRQMAYVAAHRDAVPSAYAATVSLADHQKAADYTIAAGRFSLLRQAVNLVVILGWLLVGYDALYGAVADALGGDGVITGVVFLIATSLIGSVFDLPFAIWHEFRIETAFGFSRMTPGLFVRDQLRDQAIGLALSAPMLGGVLWLMEHLSGLWWLYAWVGVVAFAAVMMYVYPTWIAPLTNKFTPMEDGPLKRRIEGLLARTGFTNGGLYVMDGSKRSTKSNAYFTGFGRKKRIVLFDTLIAQLTPEEIEAVLAHEIGHFVAKDVRTNALRMFAMMLVGFWSLGVAIKQPWFVDGLGFAHHADAISIMAFMMCLAPLSLLLQPLLSGLSRRMEFRADTYAARLLGTGAPLASALVKLTRDNAATLTPDPLFALFYYSHPPAPERVARLIGDQGIVLSGEVTAPPTDPATA